MSPAPHDGPAQPDGSGQSGQHDGPAPHEASAQPDGPMNRIAYAVLKYAFWGVFRVWNRITVEGMEHVPDGACVWVPNHRSYIDTPIHAAVPRRVSLMGKDSMWKYRWTGWLFTAIGCFPVNRDIADRAAMRTALGMLRHGDRPVVLFAEGSRRDGPRLHPLLDGPAYLAAKAQVPIVPVGIGGTAAAMPRGAKFLYPRRIRIIVGEPLPPPPLGPGARVSRKAVRAATAELSDRIQDLFDEAMARNGTPNVY